MNIFVVGGGFAGIEAAKKINTGKIKAKISLIDKKDFAVMIPVLPDLAGDKVRPAILKEKIARLIPFNIPFIKEEVHEINLNEKEIVTDKNKYNYDYLVITTGNTTNFFNFNKSLGKIYSLKSLDDTIKLKNDYLSYLNNTNNSNLNLVISGGGYTGLELASQLRERASFLKKDIKINIIENSESVLPFLSSKQKKKALDYLERKKINIICKSKVTDFDGKNVTINNGDKVINNVFFCWCAGTKLGIQVNGDNIEQLNDGRIIVNTKLQIPSYPEVFVAGDAAAIKKDKIILRKALNFSIYSGKYAGKNLSKLIKSKKMKNFKPFDLGWVIPLNDFSIGKIFNKIPVSGKLGLRLHYFMSGYRNYNLKNAFSFYLIALKLFKYSGKLKK